MVPEFPRPRTENIDPYPEVSRSSDAGGMPDAPLSTCPLAGQEASDMAAPEKDTLIPLSAARVRDGEFQGLPADILPPSEVEERTDVPELMEKLEVPEFRTEADRVAFLKGLTTERLLDGISTISSTARGVPAGENRPGDPLDRVLIARFNRDTGKIVGIRYIAPKCELGEEALDEALETAKQLSDVPSAAAMLRLAIPFAHVRCDGNGAAARFFEKALTQGYDGSPEAAAEYARLLESQSSRQLPSVERRWHEAGGKYLAQQSAEAQGLEALDGRTSVGWDADFWNAPIIEANGGFYFVEDHFAPSLSLEYLAASGRNPQEYLVRPVIGGPPLIDTARLLRDILPQEVPNILAIGDRQKTAFIGAFIAHFVTGQHPAFRGMSVDRRS